MNNINTKSAYCPPEDEAALCFYNLSCLIFCLQLSTAEEFNMRLISFILCVFKLTVLLTCKKKIVNVSVTGDLCYSEEIFMGEINVNIHSSTHMNCF